MAEPKNASAHNCYNRQGEKYNKLITQLRRTDLISAVLPYILS